MQSVGRQGRHTIFIDKRVGSGELAAPLAQTGPVVETTQLDFGDIAFAGNGPEASTLQIGIERKKLPDLLDSFATGRLVNHQLPGLTTEFDHVYLVVEGRYRAGETGLLEWGREGKWKPETTITNWEVAGYGMRRWMYRELEGRLSTLAIKAGITIVRTSCMDDTVRWIAALYDWYTADVWEEHRSHLASPLKAQLAGLRPPTLRERVAAQLPHIGARKAAMVAGHFASVRAMVNAEVAEWTTLPRIGKTIAKDIVAAVGEAA